MNYHFYNRYHTSASDEGI